MPLSQPCLPSPTCSSSHSPLILVHLIHFVSIPAVLPSLLPLLPHIPLHWPSSPFIRPLAPHCTLASCWQPSSQPPCPPLSSAGSPPLSLSPSRPLLTMHHPLPPSDHLIGPQRLLSPSPDWVRGVCASPSLHRKLCALLAQLLQQGRLVGVQVCAYMGGEVVVDVAAGFLGRYDPRAVQHDSLFSVFSATKGVTSGIMHWLAHNRRVQLEGRVADIWPGFEGKGKHQVT
ncbi:unnamed protein product, partial [Closterium sp. NIES-53]